MPKIDCGISPKAIRAQVAGILSSEGFARCRRMQRFLEFVVEETLAGRAAQLAEYGVGMAVFDRGEDFEPAVDPIVRNDARRLRQKLAEYYRSASPSVSVLIEIPKGGYVPVFSSLSKPGVRLAVLPFQVVSVQAESWNFAGALSASLSAALGSVPGAEVIAAGYAPGFPSHPADPHQQATHGIQVSVLQFNGVHRILVNLIQVTDGVQLWAREYQTTHRSMFALRHEIVGTVLKEVAARVGSSRPQPVTMAMAA